MLWRQEATASGLGQDKRSVGRDEWLDSDKIVYSSYWQKIIAFKSFAKMYLEEKKYFYLNHRIPEPEGNINFTQSKFLFHDGRTWGSESWNIVPIISPLR